MTTQSTRARNSGALSPVERQIVLFSAGTAARRNRQRAEMETLVEGIDWSRLGEALWLRGLIPSLGPRIVELAAGRVNDGFTALVERTIEAGRRQSVFLQLFTRRVIATLAAAGIRSAPLKGPLMGELLYGDPGRRISHDIDLLVPLAQLPEAVEVIRQLGYGPPEDHTEDDGLPQLHFALIHAAQELPSIELHWRIHWYERKFAQERLLPPTCEATGTWRPGAADELLALLQFYARDGFVDLRLATDIGAWWDLRGQELRRGEIGDLIRAYPALLHAVSVAARVAEATVGLPGRDVIGEPPTLTLRDRMAIRLANPHPEDGEAQIYAEIGLIDGLLTPRRDVAKFVRRQLLLPSEVVEARERGDNRSGVRPRLRPRGRVGHGLAVLGRYGLAMGRLARREAKP